MPLKFTLGDGLSIVSEFICSLTDRYPSTTTHGTFLFSDFSPSSELVLIKHSASSESVLSTDSELLSSVSTRGLKEIRTKSAGT